MRPAPSIGGGKPLKIFRFLAALVLLAPLSQSAWADLCIDPATGGWATCSASATGPLGAPGPIGGGTPSTGAFTTLSVTGQLTSTLANGTAPFVVASSTNVANLNASSLSGATFANPGAIGGGTPGSGAFTTLSATGVITSTLATGTAPFTVASTTNVANLNASSLGGATFASPGAIGGTVASAGSFTTLNATGLITPSTTSGVKGTAAADTAIAGSVGETPALNCPAASTATITVTIATPAVVTWSSHPFSGAEISSGNWTCAINFTNSGGALPTGIVAGTNYFIVGSTLSGDTFQISDTVAHALAGTNIVATSGSQSGTQTGWMGGFMANGSNIVVGAMNLSAGDYDCTGDATMAPVTSLTTTGWGAVINTSNVATFTHGQSTRYQVASLSVGTTVFDLALPVVRTNSSSTVTMTLGVIIAFSGGTVNTGGVLRCRRMR